MPSEKPVKDPVPVYYLKEKIESWGVSGDSVVMAPRDASFDELHVRRVFLQWGFGEFKWQFTGFIKVVSSDEMNEQSAELYRVLKNLETDLMWKGVILKRPIFAVSSNLKDLALRIDSLKPNDGLAEELNSNEGVLELVRRAKPDILRIRLESIPLKGPELVGADMVEMPDLARRYYENPYRVVWLIAVTRMNLPNPWIGNLMKNSYNLVDAIAESVKRKTDEMRTMSSSP